MWTDLAGTSVRKVFKCHADVDDLECGNHIFRIIKEESGIHYIECNLCSERYPLTLVVNGNK